jgi:hypothetical protein
MSQQKHIVEFIEKFRLQIEIILYVVLVLAIVFENKIPSDYKYFGQSTLFRVFAFGLVLATTQYISFSHGLLLALFVALYISFTPGFKEAFEDLRIVARKQQKWYDEKVLKENPFLMENEKVNTQPVQST